MPKLKNPLTGETAIATEAGAAAFLEKGWELADSFAPAAAASAGWPDTHAALDAIAESITGFEWPEPPDGKKKLTVAEKIAALEAAGYTPPTN